MRRTLTFVGSILALAFVGPAAAAEDAAQPPAVERPPTATATELLSIAEQYEQQIAMLQADYGPYDARLGEQLLSQGRVYQQLQDHGRALEALKRSHHIKRVNDGLQDLGQVPLLQEIIESKIALRDWPEVDQSFDQLLWIYRRNFQEGDAELLKIYDQVGRWKIQAYRDGLLASNAYETVSEAAWLFSRSIKLTEQRYGENDPRLIDLRYGHVMASYHAMIEFANRPLDKYVDRQATSPVSYVQRCYPVRMSNGRVATQCVSIPVTNFGTYARAQDERDYDVKRHYHAARASLERIVAIHDAHPELPPESRAEALVHLGDWHILGGSADTALELYQQAWRLLQGLPDGDRRLAETFGDPVSVPALRMSLPSVDRQVAPENQGEYVAISYDVSTTGRVRNAEITEATPGVTTASRRKALESVRGKRFRPRIENGVAVDTLGAVKRFSIN
jgi:tetratricopeptide (TPR) repeat protein